jgi:tetratricopeptide (TPR) repeat protein
MAAYAGAYWHFDADRPPRILHAQYSREYLLAQNFLTPSAVIFSRELLQRGCRFDETLTICEDWDFWIQLSGHTRFLRTGAMTSYWRAWKGESGTGARQDADHLMQTTAAVTRKWAALAQQLNRETRVLLEQGLARQREDDWRGAQTLYRQVLESNPYNANALNLAGMVALHFGRHDVAIPLLVRAAGLSGAAPFYYNLGLAFETSDQLESARKAYAMALDIDPGFEPARTKLA